MPPPTPPCSQRCLPSHLFHFPDIIQHFHWGHRGPSQPAAGLRLQPGSVRSFRPILLSHPPVSTPQSRVLEVAPLICTWENGGAACPRGDRGCRFFPNSAHLRVNLDPHFCPFPLGVPSQTCATHPLDHCDLAGEEGVEMHMDLRFRFLLFGVYTHAAHPPPSLTTSGLCSLPWVPDHPSRFCPHSLGWGALRDRPQAARQ